jgi:hypothetical protein
VEFREKWRKLNISLNDVFVAVISATLKEYFVSRGDNLTQDIMVLFPIAWFP